MTDLAKADMPVHRRVLYFVTNWSLFVAGMVNLVVGTWFAAHSDAAIAATSLTAGLVLLFAATIDRFESVKGLGVEAKTRKLDEKISQADEALRKLRALTELTGAALVDLNSKIGRWNTAPTPREALALAESVRSIMVTIESEPSTINSALRPWALTVCYDLAKWFAAALIKLMSAKINDLIMLRQAIPIDQNNPERDRLTKEIDAGNAYVERVRNVCRFELDDFPECFLSMFENVPCLSPEELLPLRKDALRFAADMAKLKQSMSLPNSEAWMQKLEEARRDVG